MNIYDAIMNVIDRDNTEGRAPGDDHPVTLDADVRDEFVYIRFPDGTICIDKHGNCKYL